MALVPAAKLSPDQVSRFYEQVVARGLTPHGAAPHARDAAWQYHVADTDSGTEVIGASGGRDEFRATHFGNAVVSTNMQPPLPICAIRLEGPDVHVGLPKPTSRLSATGAIVRLGKLLDAYPRDTTPKLLLGAWHAANRDPINMLYKLCLIDSGRTIFGVTDRTYRQIPLVGTNNRVTIPNQTTVAFSVVDQDGPAVCLSGFSRQTAIDAFRDPVRICDADGHTLSLTAFNARDWLNDPSAMILALLGKDQTGRAKQAQLRFEAGYPHEGFDADSWRREDLAKFALIDGRLRLTQATLSGIRSRHCSTIATDLNTYRFVQLPNGSYYMVIPGTEVKFDHRGRITEVFVTRSPDEYFDEIKHNRRAERLVISYQTDEDVTLTFTPANFGPLDDDPKQPRQT